MNERDKELARSIDPDAWKKLHKDDEDWCQRFAELVRADEREAAEERVVTLYETCETPYLLDITKAIRKQGVKR